MPVPGVEALSRVDFDWTARVDGIWGAPPYDVPELHKDVRSQLARRIGELGELDAQRGVLGQPVVGTTGAGKTHLLGAVRTMAMSEGAGFVLVDMTDVHDFWNTAQLGFLGALTRPGPSGQPQFREILTHIYEKHATAGSGLINVDRAAGYAVERLIEHVGVFVSTVLTRFAAARPHADVLRAMAYLNSQHYEAYAAGEAWLQGYDLGPDVRARFGFKANQPPAARAILQALAWLWTLKGPLVVVFDQLDAIVAEHRLATRTPSQDPHVRARQDLSRQIIQGLGNGLMSMFDTTRRTLNVVSCLETTWNILHEENLQSFTDRYMPAVRLNAEHGPAALARIVEARLGPAWAQHQVPYPTWPFRPEAFRDLTVTPRELLKRCHEHFQRCLREGQIRELTSFVGNDGPVAPPPVASLEKMNRQFDEERARASIAELRTKDGEDELDELMDLACGVLKEEVSLPGHLDLEVDREFAGRGNPLHTRLRLIDRSQGDKERHFAFRAIEHENASAFQARLNAAMTASGIDRDLDFRALRILRSSPPPGGPKTQALVGAFRERGGQFVRVSDDELRTLVALRALLRQPDPECSAWVAARRPLAGLPLFQDALRFLLGPAPSSTDRTPSSGPSLATPTAPAGSPPGTASGPARSPPGAARRPGKAPPGTATGPAAPPPVVGTGVPSAAPGQTAAMGPDTPVPPPEPARNVSLPRLLPLGRKLVGGSAGPEVEMELDELTRHAVILASAGSGKSVLLRRIVEEAALLGVPSIVVDVANDLSRLGDPWPSRPAEFDDGDQAKAARFFSAVDVVVWTPGKSTGRPMRLEPLPDLAPLLNDPDELEAGLQLSSDALVPLLLGTGARASDPGRLGVLRVVLEQQARAGLPGLPGLLSLLREPPPEVTQSYRNGNRYTADMAEALQGRMHTNTLLKGEGAALDPGVLLRGPDPARTRVSVVNLAGLGALASQQQFVNQLAMLLFSWVKKHPPAEGVGLRGLLVIDEAKDFVPSGAGAASKASLVRLAAQARKYGLGLVFATQAPRSIDHQVIANCTTHFYGKANSPAAIDVIEELLKQKGGAASEVARLAQGTFYVHTEKMAAPVRVKSRLCLTHHPSGAPLDEAGVLERARRAERFPPPA